MSGWPSGKIRPSESAARPGPGRKGTRTGEIRDGQERPGAQPGCSDGPGPVRSNRKLERTPPRRGRHRVTWSYRRDGPYSITGPGRHGRGVKLERNEKGRSVTARLSLGVTVNYCSAVQALKLAKPSGAGGPQRPSEAFSSLRRGRVAESEPGNLKKTQPSLVCVQFIWPGFSLSTTSEWDASSLTARLPYVIRSSSCQ